MNRKFKFEFEDQSSKNSISFSELEIVLQQLKIEVLLITFSDTERYLNLPLHHRDPIDRILVA